MAEPRCFFVRTSVPLAAATPVVVDVDINFARHWTIVIKNIGANPLTSISGARVPTGDLPENAVVFTDDLPLAAGATYTAIDGDGEPVQKFRLTLTSTVGTSVKINAVGD